MCTAICDNTNGFLFGRTLDLERSYDERVILTPRRKALDFLHMPPTSEHLAMLGIGIVFGDKPLYFDAVNEAGLAVAALNFPRSAVYKDILPNAHNLASFEVIPYLLAHCNSIESAKDILRDLNITNDSVSATLPTSPLHWIISDKKSALALESTVDGVRIYDNPFGVLTNEPPFPFHLSNTASFAPLSSHPQKNHIAPSVEILPHSRGSGAFGLPGDLSSPSRFVRAVFMKNHTDVSENASVSRFFHIMENISVPRGSIKTDTGASVYTVYTSCGDPRSMTYYFTTYSSRTIRCITPHNDEISGDRILSLPIFEEEQICAVCFSNQNENRGQLK